MTDNATAPAAMEPWLAEWNAYPGPDNGVWKTIGNGPTKDAVDALRAAAANWPEKTEELAAETARNLTAGLLERTARAAATSPHAPFPENLNLLAGRETAAWQEQAAGLLGTAWPSSSPKQRGPGTAPKASRRSSSSPSRPTGTPPDRNASPWRDKPGGNGSKPRRPTRRP